MRSVRKEVAMDNDLRRRELAIDRFWNALATGTPDADAPDSSLDDDTAAQIRRLHALAHAQTPAGAQARLQRVLEHARPHPQSTTNGKGAAMNGVATLSGPFTPALPVPSNGRAP